MPCYFHSSRVPSEPWTEWASYQQIIFSTTTITIVVPQKHLYKQLVGEPKRRRKEINLNSIGSGDEPISE